MQDKTKPLSLVLFSGTDDKVTAASVLALAGPRVGIAATRGDPSRARF